ncbi:MAG: alpha/beta hydrolase [Sinomicrobium sp.]|nr:alpha/beta hydrolase [Sinomicrobium sp.]
MKSINSKTIVFIHGAFVHYSTWQEWRDYFASKGYKTLMPAWPHKEAAPEVLRGSQPNRDIASLHLKDLIEHYTGIIKALPEKPILIGHSYGGLLTQILVNRDLAAAGICIHPVPPQGVIPYEFSFLRAGWKSLGLFTNANKAYLMSFKDWQYAFTNGMTLHAQKRAYETAVVPESKRVSRDGLSAAARVDFKKDHAPLLFMAGTADHIMPSTLT